MKKSLTILVAVAMMLSISGTVLAARLQQVTYSSGFQVANLSATDDASINITYYPQGTAAPVDVTDTIPAGGSVTYAAIHSAAGTPFNGSVVVTADQPVAAIANTLGSFPAYAAATGGFSEGAQSVSLPLVMCNNNGFDTWFNVQNAGSGDANITIDYVPGLNGTADQDTATIAPGRALTFDQKSGSSTASCGNGLGTTFVGGATITSNEPVVATVMQINESGFNVLMGYNGFTGGSDDVRAPLIMQANSGFYTGIQVQNAGTVSTTVTIEYAADTSGNGTVLADDVFGLDAGASQTILHDGTATYIGAATVTSSNGEPLVAIVNQVLPGTVSFGTAYEAFSAADATADINVPLVMANNSTYYTGIQVQNVSSTDACAVTIAFGPNGMGTGTPSDLNFSLDAGESATYIQNDNDLTNDWDVIGQYVGSANVTAGCSIVAIVNEFSPNFAGDQFYTFDAFNY
jgi:hypothetical protein